jgi:hypothetical protein
LLKQTHGPEALSDLAPLQLAGSPQVGGPGEASGLLQQFEVVLGGRSQGLVGAFQAVLRRLARMGLCGAAEAAQADQEGAVTGPGKGV